MDWINRNDLISSNFIFLTIEFKFLHLNNFLHRRLFNIILFFIIHKFILSHYCLRIFFTIYHIILSYHRLRIFSYYSFIVIICRKILMCFYYVNSIFQRSKNFYYQIYRLICAIFQIWIFELANIDNLF